MANFRPFAHPWWVNLLLLVPLLAYLLFRRKQPRLTSRSLLACAVFALSFGFVEGAVAIYLGVALGLLPAHAGTLSDLARLTPDLDGIQAQQFSNLSPGLRTVEIIREAATMLMLLSVAILAVEKWRERLLYLSLDRFAHKLGRAVFYPSTVDCASVVSGCCKHPDPGSGAIDEKAEVA